MCRKFITNIYDKGYSASIIRVPLDTEYTWYGYEQKVDYVPWKPGSGSRPIQRVVKCDRPKHRGIRYSQVNTRKHKWNQYLYKDRIEGQTFPDYLPFIE